MNLTRSVLSRMRLLLGGQPSWRDYLRAGLPLPSIMGGTSTFLISIFWDPVFVDPKFIQVTAGVANIGAVVLTLPAALFPNSLPHILAIIAGYSDNSTGAMTIAQTGSTTATYTVGAATGTASSYTRLTQPQWLVNAAITITLPAGAALSYCTAIWRIM